MIIKIEVIKRRSLDKRTTRMTTTKRRKEGRVEMTTTKYCPEISLLIEMTTSHKVTTTILSRKASNEMTEKIINKENLLIEERIIKDDPLVTEGAQVSKESLTTFSPPTIKLPSFTAPR